MRYSEVNVTTTTGISGFGREKENSSRAIENLSERERLNTRFAEIGAYPYNYNSISKKTYNKSYTQKDVEEAILLGVKSASGDYLKFYGNEDYSNIQNYVQDQDLVYFIKDTKISATVAGLGNILTDAENIVKEKNDSLIQDDTYYVYPVIQVLTYHYNGSGAYDRAMTNGNQTVRSNPRDNYVAFDIDETKGVKVYTAPGHFTKVVTQRFTRLGRIYKYNYKGSNIQNNRFWLNPKEEGTPCHLGCSHGGEYPYYSRHHTKCIKGYREEKEDTTRDKAILNIYKVIEGYSTKEENGIRFAVFNRTNEPYLSTPWNSKGRNIQTIYNELVSNIDELNRTDKKYLSNVNLGLKYRPTMDLGLYNDVIEAYVDVNTDKNATYEYDKRMSNGKAFSFGVNDYDIINPNTNSNYESTYEDYYNKLSNGRANEINNISKQNELIFEDFRQKEDIFPNENAGVTETGESSAGGYAPYKPTIQLTYKIRVINQSGVETTVTEIADYYDNEFIFVDAYLDREKTKSIKSNTSDASMYLDRGYSANSPSGDYKTKYITLNKTLKNNEYIDIYVVLDMIDPRVSLLGYLEPGGEGYKTLNYAEINGYKTNIGVLDIDSVPGNLTTDGKARFENGVYEDDESKSPTFIIRNPGDKVRTIQGTLFEDKTNSQTTVSEKRDGDGILNGDTNIVGGIVQLIEVDKSGNVVTSPTDNGTGIRAQTLTDSNGNYKFTEIKAGNYIVKFIYGKNYETILTRISENNVTKEMPKNQDIDIFMLNENRTISLQNNKSYNGQDYENTTYQGASGNIHWYIEGLGENATRYSDAIDIKSRRNDVIGYSTILTNHKAEVFNSYKDSDPNEDLLRELRDKTWMGAETELMSLEVENYNNYPELLVAIDQNGKYNYDYAITNIDFGIVERERAELQITKKVTKISLVDSSGRPITEGTLDDLIEGKMKYVKWLQNEEDTKGFVDMEIDQELLSGATLKITYEMAVTNTSETSSEQPNTIRNIQLIDYVSNNLNYDISYGNNSVQGWNPVTVQNLMNSGLLNKTSLETDDDSNRIDLLSYQTILTTTIDSLSAGETKKKELTLEKNLSAQEESDFNYENQVEIVQSSNENGRGDYSSIYGNLDPETYTSRQGDLKWDPISVKDERGFRQEKTAIADGITGSAIREAEKDSGNAEEVIITPPTGAKGIVLQTYHYVLALISLITTAIGITIIKKQIKIQQ